MKLLRAPFDDLAVVAKLQPAFVAQRWLMLPGACEPGQAPKPRFRKLDIPTRGKYEFADLEPIAALREFAEALTGQKLSTRWTRLYRFRWRGYSLFFDDAQSRLSTGFELTLDLSAEMRGPPAVYQSGPTQRIEIPQAPGLVALVERTPAMFRYDRYLPAEVGRAAVVRLRAAFEYGR